MYTPMPRRCFDEMSHLDGAGHVGHNRVAQNLYGKVIPL